MSGICSCKKESTQPIQNNSINSQQPFYPSYNDYLGNWIYATPHTIQNVNIRQGAAANKIDVMLPISNNWVESVCFNSDWKEFEILEQNQTTDSMANQTYRGYVWLTTKNEMNIKIEIESWNYYQSPNHYFAQFSDSLHYWCICHR